MNSDLAIIFETSSFARAKWYAGHVASLCECETSLKRDGELWQVFAPARLHSDFYRQPELRAPDDDFVEERKTFGFDQCLRCNGSGEVMSFTGPCDCPDCTGSGEVRVEL